MSFGRDLQLEREKQELSLAYVAERTGVPEPYLAALEQEHFDQIPREDVAGILRIYCGDLSLNEDAWLERLQGTWPELTAPGQPQPAEDVQPNRVATGSGTALRWWGVLFMLLVLAAIAWAAWTYVIRPRVLGPSPAGPSAGIHHAGSFASHTGRRPALESIAALSVYSTATLLPRTVLPEAAFLNAAEQRCESRLIQVE